MKRYCTVCGKIHEGRCKAEYIARNSAADRFRNTKAWRKKSAEIMTRDFHCCRVCAASGIITVSDLSVHHIVPIAADYDRRLDNDNLITLCRFHHEQAERGAINATALRRLAATGFAPSDICISPRMHIH